MRSKFFTLTVICILFTFFFSCNPDISQEDTDLFTGLSEEPPRVIIDDYISIDPTQTNSCTGMYWLSDFYYSCDEGTYVWREYSNYATNRIYLETYICSHVKFVVIFTSPGLLISSIDSEYDFIDIKRRFPTTHYNPPADHVIVLGIQNKETGAMEDIEIVKVKLVC